VQGHHSAKPHTSCQVLAVVVVVNLLTLTLIFIILIRGSLIFATFSAAAMGVGLYAGRLIGEYIRYCYTSYAVRIDYF